MGAVLLHQISSAPPTVICGWFLELDCLYDDDRVILMLL